MIRLKAPFETGTASTGHRVVDGFCYVDTPKQAALLFDQRFWPAGEGEPPVEEIVTQEEARQEEARAEIEAAAEAYEAEKVKAEEAQIEVTRIRRRK